jgi:hypothetical protein
MIFLFLEFSQENLENDNADMSLGFALGTKGTGRCGKAMGFYPGGEMI